jgi:hypothetical protein
MRFSTPAPGDHFHFAPKVSPIRLRMRVPILLTEDQKQHLRDYFRDWGNSASASWFRGRTFASPVIPSSNTMSRER